MAAGLQVLPSGQRGKWIGITVLHNKLRHFLTDSGRTHIGRIGCVGLVAGACPVAARVDGRWMPCISGVHGRSIRVTRSSGRSLSCWLGG